MIYTNRLNLPQELCDAVRNDPYDNGGAWRSVTQLISPPRLIVLKKQHDHEIVVDYADLLYALYGQIVHDILRRSKTENLVEERLFTHVEGKKISGGFDVFQIKEKRLIDWKFSTVWKALGTQEDWVNQVNLLCYLCRLQNWDVQELEIVLLMRDHSKPRARREQEYPQFPVKRIPIPLWSMEEQYNYLYDRVMKHSDAETALPRCQPRDQWQKPSVYAVMKKGRKSAIKGGLHDDLEAAKTMAKDDPDYYVEVRQGENTRCLDYCVASKFCEQHKEELLHV